MCKYLKMIYCYPQYQHWQTKNIKCLKCMNLLSIKISQTSKKLLTFCRKTEFSLHFLSLFSLCKEDRKDVVIYNRIVVFFCLCCSTVTSKLYLFTSSSASWSESDSWRERKRANDAVNAITYYYYINTNLRFIQTHLRVCWESDVKVADSIVGKTTVRARFLGERQATTRLLRCVSDLFVCNNSAH